MASEAICHKFADYFCSTYIETTIFPPLLWAQVPSSAHRTNNGPESFHQHFSALFTLLDPKLFIFGCACVIVLTQLHLLSLLNENDDSDFFVHEINLSNSRLQDSSSCALSLTVTCVCLIYILQTVVT